MAGVVVLLNFSIARTHPSHDTMRYNFPKAETTAIAPAPSPSARVIPHHSVEVLSADRILVNGREFVAAHPGQSGGQRRGVTPCPPPPECPDAEKALSPSSGAEFWM